MIKAIPTYYNGVTFRSRLEAHWAEYFDSIGLKWFYEPEGYFISGHTGYLPDFYIPQLKIYAECKAWKGPRLSKVGLFVKESCNDVLVCLPNGQFLLCSSYSWLAADDGVYEPSTIPEALILEDWDYIDEIMKVKSSLTLGPYGAQFTNLGEVSDHYTGWEPDYCNSAKDTEVNGRDARVYYWAGFSKWEQRDFRPAKSRGSRR